MQHLVLAINLHTSASIFSIFFDFLQDPLYHFLRKKLYSSQEVDLRRPLFFQYARGLEGKKKFFSNNEKNVREGTASP